MTQTFKAINRQSLFDVCLMTYGRIDLIYKLIQDNGIKNINQFNIDQINFSFDDTLVLDNFVYLNNTNNSVIYGTADNETESGLQADQAGELEFLFSDQGIKLEASQS